MKRIRLFFAVIILLITNSLVAQTNYVPNGNFEQETWVDGTKPQEWQSNSGSGETESWRINAAATTENPTNVSIPEGAYMYYIKCLLPTTYDWQTIKKVAGSTLLSNGSYYILKFKIYSILGSGTVNPTVKVFSEMKKYNWPSVDKTTYTIEPGAWRSFSVPFRFYDAGGTIGEQIELDLGFILKGNVAGTVFFFDDISVTEDLSIGINDLKSSAISYYPNPVTDRFKITGGNFNRAEIYNISGVIVSSRKIELNNEIDFTPLPSGTYIVKLYGEDQATIKVLKK